MGGSGNRNDQIASLMVELEPVHERRSADKIKNDILTMQNYYLELLLKLIKFIVNLIQVEKDIQLEITSNNQENLERITSLITNKLKIWMVSKKSIIQCLYLG